MIRRNKKPKTQKNGLFEYLQDFEERNSHSFFTIQDDKVKKDFNQFKVKNGSNKFNGQKADQSQYSNKYSASTNWSKNCNQKETEKTYKENRSQIRSTKIFFDEYNKKNIRMPIYKESELDFLGNKEIFIPIIKHPVDNDVNTDDETLTDSAIMMKNNLKNAIRKLKKNKILLDSLENMIKL
jgi:hypothetical protein